MNLKQNVTNENRMFKTFSTFSFHLKIQRPDEGLKTETFNFGKLFKL